MGTDLGLSQKKKLRLFLQSEASECGLACLAMVATYHGFETSVSDLRVRFPVSLMGVTLDQLMDMAEEIGLTPRALRLEIDELPQLQVPCVLHWNLSHFVVLKKADRNRVVIYDPAAGEHFYTIAAASKYFTGIALEFSPKLDFQRKLPPPALSLAKLVGKISGLKRGLIQLVVLAVVLESISLLIPMLTQWVTDDAIVSNDQNLLKLLCVGFLLLSVTNVGLTALRSWVGLYISTSFKLQWQSNIMGHLLRLPVEFFERRHLGDIVSRFGSLSAIENMLTSAMVDVLLDGLLAIGTLALMFAYSPKLASVALVTLILYVGLRMARYSANKHANHGYVIKEALEQTYFLETIRGVRSIKLFNRENQRRSGWLSRLVALTNAEVALQKMALGFNGAWGLLSSGERALVMWVGATAVIEGHMTLGMFFAFLSYKEQFSSRSNNLIDRFFDFKMLSVQMERLADIVLAAPEENRSATRSDSPEHLTISVENVSFRYGIGEQYIVSKMNLTIQDGECVAIVGSSGGGKSTLLKLLLGILKPQIGVIKLGDVPLSQIRLRDYRALIGTVLQDDQLYAGSIFDNIAFFDDKPDRKFVEECARAAAIHDDIIIMPMSYHTLVGDMGTVLSGGQKQRVLLARALYKRPRILFLDEATSHLDLQNEAAINVALSALKITRIMVAHRPDTIAIADRIIMVDKGKVNEVKLKSAEKQSA